MSHSLLSAAIVERSVAAHWDEARLEWGLSTVYFADEPETCLCGQFPIIELCVLSNTKNGAEAVVGNQCVKKFLGLPSDRIFLALKKIQKNIDSALNPEAIDYTFRRGWLNAWEHTFYFDTWRKRVLTDRQKATRRQINAKVIAAVAQDTRKSR